MCAIPELCSKPNFVLRGPILSPPSSGWRIMTVPLEASHLQSAWAQYPSNPSNSKEAWWNMMEFLKANGIKGAGVFKEVQEISLEQWCSPDPSRCRGKNWQPSSPDLPWAKKAWEDANHRLADNTASPGTVLSSIVRTLTSKIEGPEGCRKCARHWRRVLLTTPVPVGPTLDEARQWLVNAHNETREGKTPTPFATVAAKFNWTLSHE